MSDKLILSTPYGGVTPEWVDANGGADIEFNPVVPSGTIPTNLETIKSGDEYYGLVTKLELDTVSSEAANAVDLANSATSEVSDLSETVNSLSNDVSAIRVDVADLLQASTLINIRPSYYIEVKKPNATNPNNYDIFRILARKDMIDEGLTAMGTTMDQFVSNWSAIRTTDNAFVILQKGILAAILSRGYCVFSEETDGHITDNVSVDALSVIIEGTSFMSITSHAWLADSTFTAQTVTSIYQYID